MRGTVSPTVFIDDSNVGVARGRSGIWGVKGIRRIEIVRDIGVIRRSGAQCWLQFLPIGGVVGLLGTFRFSMVRGNRSGSSGTSFLGYW